MDNINILLEPKILNKIINIIDNINKFNIITFQNDINNIAESLIIVSNDLNKISTNLNITMIQNDINSISNNLNNISTDLNKIIPHLYI